jgi:hypothetical protein
MPDELEILSRRGGSQLQSLNEKIARLAAISPWAGIYHSFSTTAQLASDAIEAAAELQRMPGTDAHVLEPALGFWHQVRNYSCGAALAVTGENRTLAEALVAFRLLKSLAPANPQNADQMTASGSAKATVVMV